MSKRKISKINIFDDFVEEEFLNMKNDGGVNVVPPVSLTNQRRAQILPTEDNLIVPEDPVDPPVDPPITEPGLDLLIPGVGDGSIASYDPTLYNSSIAANNYDPLSTDPATSGCPSYNHPLWPQTCPQKRTWAWMEDVTRPAADFGNVFRNANGKAGLVWNKNLTLMAQRHATFIAEKFSILYTSGMPLQAQYGYFALHWETAEDDPVHPSYGASLGDRAVNSGFPNGMVGGEGIGLTNSTAGGEGPNNPMTGLCSQKSDWVDENNPGHFGPWAEPDNTRNYFGYGFDLTSGGTMIHVWVYADTVQGTIVPQKELYEYLPKFNCTPIN